jgi:hypothetical protein
MRGKLEPVEPVKCCYCGARCLAELDTKWRDPDDPSAVSVSWQCPTHPVGWFTYHKREHWADWWRSQYPDMTADMTGAAP